MILHIIYTPLIMACNACARKCCFHTRILKKKISSLPWATLLLHSPSVRSLRSLALSPLLQIEITLKLSAPTSVCLVSSCVHWLCTTDEYVSTQLFIIPRKKNGTVNTVIFSGLCSDQLLFFHLAG